MTDEVADRPDVILHFLGECERATPEPRDSLPEGVVKPLGSAILVMLRIW